ncbi:hypothetical protein B0H14DRAFT_2558280 [Mycena olivaceomarginata]|nr:hypothetical protein B0H14DRAFT_2558280 [Mycena olivaceomarginata]
MQCPVAGEIACSPIILGGLSCSWILSKISRLVHALGVRAKFVTSLLRLNSCALNLLPLCRKLTERKYVSINLRLPSINHGAKEQVLLRGLEDGSPTSAVAKSLRSDGVSGRNAARYDAQKPSAPRAAVARGRASHNPWKIKTTPEVPMLLSSRCEFYVHVGYYAAQKGVSYTHHGDEAELGLPPVPVATENKVHIIIQPSSNIGATYRRDGRGGGKSQRSNVPRDVNSSTSDEFNSKFRKNKGSNDEEGYYPAPVKKMLMNIASGDRLSKDKLGAYQALKGEHYCALGCMWLQTPTTFRRRLDAVAEVRVAESRCGQPITQAGSETKRKFKRLFPFKMFINKNCWSLNLNQTIMVSTLSVMRALGWSDYAMADFNVSGSDYVLSESDRRSHIGHMSVGIASHFSRKKWD